VCGTKRDAEKREGRKRKGEEIGCETVYIIDRREREKTDTGAG
jgi:hypothetical protein